MGVNEVTRTILDSMCFLLEIPSKARDLLEHLCWDGYEYEKSKETLGCLTIDLFVFRANSCSVDQHRDPYAQPYHFVPDYVPI